MLNETMKNSLSSYFDSVAPYVKAICKGDTDLFHQITFKMYEPFEEKVAISFLQAFSIFEESVLFLSRCAGTRFDFETIKIGGVKWHLVTNLKTGRKMPILIDGHYETTPKMIAGKFIFFILMETV